MEGIRDIDRWAVIERYGRGGETYEDVIARLYLELLPIQQIRLVRSSVSETPVPALVVEESPTTDEADLEIDEVCGEVETPDDPGTEEVETMEDSLDEPAEDSVSVVADTVDDVTTDEVVTPDPRQVEREQIAILTARQMEMGMRILAKMEKE